MSLDFTYKGHFKLMESSFGIKMSMRFADIITCFYILAVSLFDLSTFSIGSNIFIMLVSIELDKSVHQPCIWHYHQHCKVNMLYFNYHNHVYSYKWNC